MLRKIRIPLAILTITAVTLLFLGISWQCSLWIVWVAKIQFLPALLALNVGVLAFLILLTLLFGRIYCSVICPLGIMQDGFSWIAGKIKKNRFGYTKEKKWLRIGVMIIFGISLVIGFAPLTALLAPYSAYGRIISNLLRPLFDMLHNAAASLDAHYGGFHFYTVEIWSRGAIGISIALLTLIILAVWAWRKGRAYCNTICPVGTLLGLFSRFSLFKVHFDLEKCRHCSLCEKNCKASAIDSKSGTIDYSRCIVCGNCLEKCEFDALHYGKVKVKKVNPSEITKEENHSTDTQLRSFLVAAGMVTATASLAQTKLKMDGGLATIEEKKSPKRENPVTPPGSISFKHLQKHCTACQLCISSCPNNVLRPSTKWDSLMQPFMTFEKGYCRPECTRCSQVCPTGAIKPIKPEEKTAIHAGHAVWIKENCLPVTGGTSCGNCARHCPTGAIQMIPYNGVKIPSVDTAKCIGCGACENLCPAQPFSAIYVEGNEVHHLN